MTRFTIRDALFATLIVALAVPLYLTTSENLKLRDQNKSLRNEAGLLTIEDENKINFIAIPSASLHSQSWRIALPKNSDHIFQLMFSQSNIPYDGFPDPKESPTMGFTLPPNELDELILRVELKDDSSKISWSIDGLTGAYYETDEINTVWGKANTTFVVDGKNGTESASLGAKLNLFTAINQRWDPKTKTWLRNKKPDGFRIYLSSHPDYARQQKNARQQTNQPK